jgi:pimeloyl-ACP methyl ester carboxylesterase
MSMIVIAFVGFIAFALFVAAGLVLFTFLVTRSIERAVPPLGQFINVEGARVHYVDRGRGPTIVAIHGLTGQMRNFTHSLVDLLCEQFRVIAIDRPGSGYSLRAPGASARLSAQGDLVAKFIGALGLERPLVVGHSLGGAIALALALDHPECVGGLALIAPLTQPPERVPAPFHALVIRSSWRRKILAWTIATPAAIRRGPRTVAAVFSPDKPPANFATKGGGLLALRPKSFIAASEELIAVDLADMVQRYPSLKVPIAILFGTDDVILSHESNGAAMQKVVPGLALELVPGGHMLPITAPKVTAEFINAAARKFAIK